MAEWADVYKNIQQPDPLKGIAGVYGVLNADQQLRLGRQAEQVRQYDLMQNQATDLLNTAGTLANVKGITTPEVQGEMAARAKQLNINPNVYELASRKYQGLSGPALTKQLAIDAARAGGVAGLTNRTETADPNTGEPSSIPSIAAVGQSVPRGMGPEKTAAAEAAGRGETLGGVEAKLEDQKAAGIWQDRKTSQSKVIQILAKGPDNLQGLGTSEITEVRNFLNSVGLTPASEPAVMVEQLKKYYQRNIESNSNATTDFSRAGAVIGNPNINLMTASAKELAKVDTMLSRLRQAQTLSLQNVESRNYPSRKTNWNQTQDLYAYGMDMLGPKEQHDHIVSLFPASAKVAKMNDAELKTFLKSADPGKYPRWDKFRESLATAHKYQQLDLPTVGQ